MFLIVIGLLLASLATAIGLFHLGRMNRRMQPVASLTVDQLELRERLFRHVDHLANRIGERHLRSPERLLAAADYIRTEFAATGRAVRFEPLENLQGVPVGNLMVEWTGRRHPDQLLIVGAHYDTVPGTPGANDNATGIAALLEIASALKAIEPAIGLRLVAFVNEEPPFFQTERMGSLQHAILSRQSGQAVIGMFSLETLGYYTQRRGSQTFPSRLLKMLYPGRGNFLAMVGNFDSAGLLRDALATFRTGSDFPVEGLAAPAWLPGVGWSDHWSFWQQGYPAVMLTDTALFRYPHYHSGEDTPAQLSMDEYTRVVDGVIAMILSLVSADPGVPGR